MTERAEPPGDGVLPRSWPRPALTAAMVLVAGVVPVVGALGGVARGEPRVVLWVSSALLAMLAVYLASEERARSSAREKAAADIAVDAQARLTVAVNGALYPMTDYLGSLAVAQDEAERQHLVGQLTQGVVGAAVTLTLPAARAVFYRLVDEGRALQVSAYAGRPAAPRERFDAGTKDGDTVLAMVTADQWVLVPDVRQDPIVTPRSEGYRTVVAVAVVAGEVPVGMLTVDAPAPGDLRAEDVALLRVLGNLLAAGVAEGSPPVQQAAP